MATKFLIALPVYNEVSHVGPVLDQVLQHSADVLVVDDGSTDGTSELLARRTDIKVLRHPVNRGYGAALKTAFEHTLAEHYDALITIDCDGQHEPQRIPLFMEATPRAQIVSGSRYLEQFADDSRPPEQRRRINAQLTAEINERLGLRLTDAFCGFKAYRADALERLHITEPGYGMPLEVWVQAAHAGLSIIELPVPLVYLDEARSFGGALDDAARRLQYYHDVLERSSAKLQDLPKSQRDCGSLCGESA